MGLMPFLVADKLDDREKRIRGFLGDKEPVIAVLLAAADCERTVRRAILALGTEPIAVIRSMVAKNYNSIGKYEAAWNRYVKPRHGASLDHDVISSMDALKKAFVHRNAIVHGQQGTTGVKYAAQRVDVMLTATRAVHDYALSKGVRLDAPLKRRTAQVRR
jgi:hypothetical protein